MCTCIIHEVLCLAIVNVNVTEYVQQNVKHVKFIAIGCVLSSSKYSKLVWHPFPISFPLWRLRSSESRSRRHGSSVVRLPNTNSWLRLSILMSKCRFQVVSQCRLAVTQSLCRVLRALPQCSQPARTNVPSCVRSHAIDEGAYRRRMVVVPRRQRRRCGVGSERGPVFNQTALDTASNHERTAGLRLSVLSPRQGHRKFP